jgi:hypothetical protein
MGMQARVLPRQEVRHLPLTDPLPDEPFKLLGIYQSWIGNT